MIELRPATIADSDRLLAWRNDPQTCAASNSTAPVTPEHHKLWMQFHVAQGYPEYLVMVADSNLGPVGVVQFTSDKEDSMTFEVGITIAPNHRGKRLALPVLDKACKFMSDFTINAHVKGWNAASRRIFERCGFEEIGSENGIVAYRREPL